MDPNPRNHPILSYVMSKLPSFTTSSTSNDFDIEQPQIKTTSSLDITIESHMPRLTDPKLLKELTLAISEVSQTRSMLQTLGDRPDHETVDKAKEKVKEIEERMEREMEVVSREEDVAEIRRKAEEERELFKSIVVLDEMHEAYGKLLKESEEKLVRIYDEHKGGSVEDGEVDVGGEMVSEEVVEILQEAGSGKEVEKVDLSGRSLRVLPEAFGKIRGLILLNLSNNQLQVYSLCFFLFSDFSFKY